MRRLIVTDDKKVLPKCKEEIITPQKKGTMENGCIFMVFVALIGSGGVLMSYWWAKDDTYTAYVIKDDNTDKRVEMTTDKNVDMITGKRVDMTTDQREDIGNIRQELLQCKTRITQIKQDFTSLQTNFIQTQEKVEHLTKVITDSIKDARDDFLHLKRDMKILNGMQEIHDHRYITYSETAYLLLVGLILETLIIFLIVYKYFPWRNGNHGSQG